jgi:predicted Na+-dependent transporter
MRNNAAGVVIALQYFGAEVALPVIICIFLQQLTAGGVYSLLQRKNYGQAKEYIS